MKQGTIITKIVMLLLFTAVVIYLGAAVWQSLADPFSTVVAYRYTMDDAAEATGYLVREETALPSGTGIVDILPGEGEKLGAGQTVAVLYRDEDALQRRQTIRSLEVKLTQLEYSLRQEDDTAEAGRLDEEIYAAMADLRTASVRHDYSDLDDQVLSLKSLVFRREYALGSDTAAGVEDMISSVSAEISSLQAVASGDTSTITTSCSGVYSGLVDGYETVFTPAALTGLTVSGYRTLAGTAASEPGDAVGKLITSSRWYFAVLLGEAEAGRLTEGSQVTVAFTHDFTGEVSMLVEHISRPESGQAAVVLSSTRCLSDITLLRKQTVDIIFHRYTGIRVPKKALRVLEDGTTGVYVEAGAIAEFKEADILAQGEDYYLLASPESGAGKRVLRPGDEIIVAAEELYDGKVVRNIE